jgi:redox-sensitive bicupin YhaK (pirin superfamily)
MRSAAIRFGYARTNTRRLSMNSTESGMTQTTQLTAETDLCEKRGMRNKWRLLATGKPRYGALTIHQDVDLYAARLGAGQRLDHVTSPDRKPWLQIARGSVDTDGDVLRAGDGVAWIDAASIHLSAREDSELLLFDMAP